MQLFILLVMAGNCQLSFPHIANKLVLLVTIITIPLKFWKAYIYRWFS